MVIKLDCAVFKRECGANPQGVLLNEDLHAHANACPQCGEFYQEMLALDIQLQTAFTVSVTQNTLDEQLSNVILPENVTSLSSKSKKQNRFAWFGAAASVLVGSLFFLTPTTENVAIADEVIGHIHYEPHLLTLTEAQVSPAKVKMVLQQVNAELISNNIKVLSAALCPVSGQLSAHLVIQGESGPVTVMVMPGKDSGTKSGIISSNEFNGRFLTAKQGNFAVVGNKKENIEQMSQSVSSGIVWLN